MIESRDFLVIGSPQSGATAVGRLLAQHPDIAVENRPLSEPVGQLRATRQKVGGVSTEYWRHPAMAAPMRSVDPDIRIVAVIRNPIDRAWSEFLLRRRNGYEPHHTLGEVLLEQRGNPAGPAGKRAEGYVEAGMYARQLENYYRHFPADRIRVELFEDLRQDPVSVMKSIFSHIGVDSSYEVKPKAPVSISGVPRNEAIAALLKAWLVARPLADRKLVKEMRPVFDRALSAHIDRPEPSPFDRRLLEGIYRTEIQDLSQLIERDLSVWTERDWTAAEATPTGEGLKRTTGQAIFDQGLFRPS